ncbi:MAG: hypothetical protein AB1638_00080 [Nitrospirota bacterium]
MVYGGIPEDSSESRAGINWFQNSMFLGMDSPEENKVKEESMWSMSSLEQDLLFEEDNMPCHHEEKH